ncbi:hypothetical protein NMG60_11005136 [Bertholletia excelsa]
MRAYLQATFLLFCILTYEVQEAIDCNDGQCSGTTKRRLSRARREFHQPLPEIHEDYYGPRSHNPKHH